MYAKVKNWEVLFRTDNIPNPSDEDYKELKKRTSWADSLIQRKPVEYGYYPLEVDSPSTEDWQKLSGYEYEILEDKVIKHDLIQEKTLDEYKQQKVDAINKATYNKITRKYGDIEQRNINARATELVDKKIDTWLTTEEQKELDEIKTAYSWIKEQRDNYQNWKDEINALTTYADVRDRASEILNTLNPDTI